MAFSASSRNLVLHGTTLYAECKNYAGEWKQSLIYLDDYLGNCFGEFEWGGNSFGLTAEDVHLEGPVLHARLCDDNSNFPHAFVDLDERITNLGGYLRYLDGSLDDEKARGHAGILYDNSAALLQLGNRRTRRKRDADGFSAQKSRKTALTAAFADRPPYKYSPLANQTSIRLLKIAPPGEDPNILQCSLIEVSLTESPKFAALSYTWGSPFPPTVPLVEQYYQETMTIDCDGRPFEVKQNLYDALHRIRHRKVEELRGCESKSDLIQMAENESLVGVVNLLRQGADVNARDNLDRTALHYAAEKGHLDIVKALVFAGSDIDVVDSSGRTPLDYVIQDRRRFPWGEIRELLIQHQDAKYAVHQGNASLQPDVTEFDHIWIDAICIDQTNSQEKASQVAMMGNIYQCAEHVIVWLGREYHNFRDTTEGLLQGAWRLEAAREAGEIPSDILEQLLNDPIEALGGSQTSRTRLAALDWLNTIGSSKVEEWFLGLPLFRRAWFERAWVTQEVFMANNLTVVCGSYLVPWDIFIFMSSTIECCRLVGVKQDLSDILGAHVENYTTKFTRGAMSLSRNPTRDEIPAVSLERRRRAFRRGHQLSMLSALSLSRNQSATDARDKVFSVLSFSPIVHPTGEGLRSIIPDYTRPTNELYIEVGKCLLAAYGPCALSLSGKSTLPQTEGLPSWVPDLNRPLFTRPHGINIAQLDNTPSGISSTEPDPEEYSFRAGKLRISSQNELFVRARIWDSISEVAHPGLNDVGVDLAGLSKWLELLSKLDVPLEKRREVLWRTIIEDATAKSPTEPLPHGLEDADFENWLKFLCFCSILGHQENFRTSVLSFAPPDIYYHEKTKRSWSQILAMLNQAQASFTTLGIPLSAEEMESWSDPHTYEDRVDAYFEDFYAAIIELAMPYGHVVRNNDPLRRLLRTEESNVLGTGPQEAQTGDMICIVDGASVPYVLRQVCDGRFELIGEAYLYGVDTESFLREAEALGKLTGVCII